jgi:hypothetical protein
MRDKKYKAILNFEELKLAICAVSALYDDLETRTLLPGEDERVSLVKATLDELEARMTVVLFGSVEAEE